MKILLTSFIVLSVCVALAKQDDKNTQTISCAFTEPFFNLTYNIEEGSLTITEPDWENDGEIVTKVIGTDLVLVNKSTDAFLPMFEVIVPSQEKVLKMTMNFNGSDGMSDQTYPIDAKWEDLNDGNTLFGGCETDKIKSVNTAYEDNNSNIITGPDDIKL